MFPAAAFFEPENSPGVLWNCGTSESSDFLLKMAQSNYSEFSHMNSMVDLSSSFFVNVETRPGRWFVELKNYWISWVPHSSPKYSQRCPGFHGDKKHHKNTFAKGVEVADLPPPGEVESLWWWVLTPDAADARLKARFFWRVDHGWSMPKRRSSSNSKAIFRIHSRCCEQKWCAMDPIKKYPLDVSIYHTMDPSW